MRRRDIIIALLCLLVLSNTATYYLARFFFSAQAVEMSRDDGEIKLFWEVWDILQENYFQDLDKDKMVRGAIKGMVDSLNDPHTSYLKPEELEELYAFTTGSFGGIGVEITKDEGEILILRVMEGTPAERAGLLQGDRIVKVENIIMESVTLDEAARLLRGPQGTQVNLTIRRVGEQEPLQVTLTRTDVEVETVFAHLISPRTGYLQITNFDQGTGEDFLNYLSFLEEEEIEGLIIDLRNNPGGLLDEAVEVGEIIVPEGEITRVVDRQGEVQERYFSSAKPKDYSIVVLVNEYSASAAEIIAGALQDSKKAFLVGTPTFGKATVQYLQFLSDGGGLRYTIAKYLTPLGRDLGHHGLQPDLEVELPPEYYLQHRSVPRGIQEGDAGEMAVLLQNMLCFLDYPLEVTGIIDIQTINALKIFQRDHHLPCNGTLNHQTREKLRSELINKAEEVDTQLQAALEIIKEHETQQQGAGSE